MPPKQLKPAPGEDPLASFSPLPEVDLKRLDRSTVQAWGNCPRQAALLATGKINHTSHAAALGDAAHQCFGDTVDEYIARGDTWMTPSDLKKWVEGAALASRPDVQPEVIAAIKYSTWAWANFICGINHANILRYDGGEGDRSGQLAVEWPELSALITSEVDLLCAGDTPEILEETDYKCGDKVHLEASVKTGFQFHFHAVLVFHNYPDAQELRVRIWNTKKNLPTYYVSFYRTKLHEYEARVHTAVAQWYQHRHTEPEKCPAWPTQEKCRLCDAAMQCDVSGMARTPEEKMRAIIATTAKLKLLTDDLTAIVDERGSDLVVDGMAFGRGKPTKKQRPKVAVYEVPKE